MSRPEENLAGALLAAFRPDFAEREATAQQLSELLLDAVSAALPLTRHAPSEPVFSELEALAQHADVYSWDGAPGWDVVLARGLGPRPPLPPGPPVVEGIGARPERTQQRGELKRRAHAEAELLVALSRRAAADDGGAAALVAAHASLLRLVGLASAASLLVLPEDPGAGVLQAARTSELLDEMESRGESSFVFAQEEWLARLLADNPAAQAPAFRTFYAGLSQSPRVAWALRLFREEADAGRLAPDPEALLGAVGTWQPVRWAPLRRGAPSEWVEALCPAAPADEKPLQRLERECAQGLDLFSRLWFAKGLSLTGFTSLAALLTARCAGISALWEELGGGAPPP
jgi:hypothetical protein